MECYLMRQIEVEIQYEGLFLKGKYSTEVIESFLYMISKYECLSDVQEKMRHTINVATKFIETRYQ